LGIIEKQTTKNTVYSYLGAGLGFITILWQSHLFSTDENGLLRILVSVSMLFAQLSNLGFSTVTVRFFPYFKSKEKGNHGFLFYALIVSLIGFILCAVAFYFFEDLIISKNIEKSRLFVDYLFYLMPLTFFTLFFFVFDTYLRSIYSSVIGSLSKDLLQRVFILVVIGFYFFKLIHFPTFVFLYIVSTCAPTLILLYSIIKQGEWQIKLVKGFVDKQLSRQMISLAVFSMFSTFSGAIILSIDVIMVNDKLGLGETGVYSIAFYFGSIILIPARAMGRIISSLIAEAFKNNDMVEIHNLYKKSSNSLLVIGMLLFIGIAVNINSIMQFLPKEYAGGKNVILIISVGYLAELGTGVNQWIILNSKHYYYDTVFVFFIVIITVFLNNILIPIYGITGSAIATATSVVLSNFLRFSFILHKYKMQPFDFNSIRILFISIVCFIAGYCIPSFENFLVDIAIKSIVVGGLFVLLIQKLNLSPEINHKIRKNLKRISVDL
jgi:O-antigen/teichoic acid export membrane protein